MKNIYFVACQGPFFIIFAEINGLIIKGLEWLKNAIIKENACQLNF